MNDFISQLKLQLNALKEQLVNFTGDEINLASIQGILDEIDNKRIDGVWRYSNNDIPEGQGELMEIMNECYELIQQKQDQLDSVFIDDELIPVKKQINHIIKEMDKCKVTHGDMVRLQSKLIDIENRYISNGIWLYPNTKGQGYMYSLLHEAYHRIYLLNCKIEKEIDEIYRRKSSSLTLDNAEIFRKLISIKRDLLIYHGDSEGLRIIQGRLNRLDNQRIQNTFGSVYTEYGIDVPPGQALLNDLFLECNEYIYQKHVYLETLEDVAVELRPIYRQIRRCLIKLHKAKLNPSNLPKIAGVLNNIDSMRQCGFFMIKDCNPYTLRGQGVLNEMLFEAYELKNRIELTLI